jgi:hypothetical protein
VRTTARAEADGGVNVIGLEVAQLVADVEAQLDLRMRGAKARQPGQQPVRGKARAQRQPQPGFAACKLARPAGGAALQA